MKSLLLVFILLTAVASSAWSLSYACRDRRGILYFTDSPLRLPESCWEEMWQVEHLWHTDNSTPVKEVKQKPAELEERPIERMIREEGLERRVKQLQQLAAAAVDKYNEGTELTKELNRSWHYGVRARRARGKKLLAEARKAKQQILEELESLGISKQRRAGIERLLGAIP